MKQLVYLVLAVGLIGFGAYRQFAGGSVSAEDKARCEQIVRANSGDSQEALDAMLPQCSQSGMVAMMDARANGADAQTAASNIAAANRTDSRTAQQNVTMRPERREVAVLEQFFARSVKNR